MQLKCTGIEDCSGKPVKEQGVKETGDSLCQGQHLITLCVCRFLGGHSPSYDRHGETFFVLCLCSECRGKHLNYSDHNGNLLTLTEFCQHGSGLPEWEARSTFRTDITIRNAGTTGKVRKAFPCNFTCPCWWHSVTLCCSLPITHAVCPQSLKAQSVLQWQSMSLAVLSHFGEVLVKCTELPILLSLFLGGKSTCLAWFTPPLFVLPP